MPDASSGLTSYAELAAVIGNLPLLMREARRARGLSMRAAAAEIGCSAPTIHRMESGADCALSNAAAVLLWLDRSDPKL
jgi:ribosome-binding protein aMBF1 (putative translation factor)